MNKKQILKEIWDNWAHKQWFKFANYESEQSNKIIVETHYYPALEVAQFRMFVGKFPEVMVEFKNPQQ